MKVTRIVYSSRLNAGKYAQLAEQARRLGRVRSLVWDWFGSITGVGLSDRQMRDAWMADGTAEQFGVLANAWKETVRDAVADIRAHRQAATVHVRRHIHCTIADEAERKRLYTLLKRDQWTSDLLVRRLMRRSWRRGHNHTTNQIIIRADKVRTFTLAEGGNVWLAVPGLAPRTSGDHAKAVRLRANNLGTVKKHRQEARWRIRVRDVTYRAVHAVADKAGVIAAEDLTRPIRSSRRYGKNTNRRLAAWTKGVTAQALHDVSERRGSALRLVNAAYTSQVIPGTSLLGRRVGDRLHCPHQARVLWDADHAAAINILDRDADPDIGLHTPHTRVKQIIQERADRHRSRLPDQDSNTTGHCRCGERNILTNDQH